MTVQELIEILSQVEDKERIIVVDCSSKVFIDTTTYQVVHITSV